MTPDTFSSMASRLNPVVRVRPILDAIQFRLGPKAFATLGWPQQGWAAIKLDSRDQAWALGLSGGLAPEPGRRRRSGIVLVRLAAVDAAVVAELLGAAWSHALGQAAAAERRPRKTDEMRRASAAAAA